MRTRNIYGVTGLGVEPSEISELSSYLTCKGKILKVGSFFDEWERDVFDPSLLVDYLKSMNLGMDLFTFAQRMPETSPKYQLPMEWDNVAIVAIESFDKWYNYEISRKARNKIRKSLKNGVLVKESVFNDEFVNGVVKIYAESPYRQGRPFLYYKKEYNEVKRMLSDRMEKSIFLGAYLRRELIGFVKFMYSDRIARPAGIISMIKHRDKAVTNALLSKCIELCDQKKIPYLMYGKFSYGNLSETSLSDFKKYNNFKEIKIPRYYVPFTLKGKMALSLNLHQGLYRFVPEKLVRSFLNYRRKWVERRST